MITAAVGLTLLLGSQDPQANPQAPVAVPTAEALLERYRKLEPPQRTTVVRNMERRLQRENDETLQRIQSAQRGTAAYQTPAGPVWYDHREYAPVATPRQLVAPGTDAHRTATARMLPFEFLPDLHCAVAYDWNLGKTTRLPLELDDDRRFANYVHGYVPASDHAVAQVLEALDNDPAQRLLGSYFEHLYADRDGRVFVGVTLFDAWNSGRQIEMPDTDAIAYARLVLGTRSFLAPLPADRRRERLYQKIRESFAAHREYRTLRWAAAAAFVAGEPRIDPTYEPLVRRCHWLWHRCGYDPKALAARFAATPDRTTLLRELDAAIEGEPDTIDGVRRTLRDVADFLRSLADYELTRASG